MQKIERYAKAPEISGGYFLEGDGDKGWFSVLVPLAITSINTNPSFETDLTGATAANSALVRTSNYQRRGVYSMQVTPSSTAAAGAYWTITTTTDGQYSCGLDLYDPAGRWFDLYFADSSGNRISRVASVRGANYWKRLWVNFAEYSGGTRRVILARRAGGNTQPFYVDGVNILPTQYKTAYFDGDKKGFLAGKTPFYWNGTAHASTYTQVFDTGNGGREVKLLDLGFRVLAVIGLGMMQFKGIATPISDGGAQYQRSVPTERAFALVGAIADTGLNGLQRVRAALEEVLNPMRTDTMQPMVLRYHRTDPVSGEETECLDIPCVFETAGLAGALSNKNAENIELPFKQYLPQIYVDGQEGINLGLWTEIDHLVTPSAQQILFKSGEGDWIDLGGAGLAAMYTAAYSQFDGCFYIGGAFSSINSIADTQGIAKWDGTQWLPLGIGTSGDIYAIVVAPDGSIYAAGLFSTIGGVSADNVAKWDGTAWAPLGAGTNNLIYALAIDAAGNLYAAGEFTTAGGSPASGVAKWDGTAWGALGNGLTGVPHPVVYALAVDPDGSTIYAGGAFTVTDDPSILRLAQWDGSTWTGLGSGVNGMVYSLGFSPDSNLYVGGSFTTAGGITVNRIAKWDGNSWFAMGDGANGNINIFKFANDGSIYIGGYFTEIGGVTARYVARYYNGLYFPLSVNILSGSPPVNAMAINPRDNSLMILGDWISTEIHVMNPTALTYERSNRVPIDLITTGPGILYGILNNGRGYYFDALQVLPGEKVVLRTDRVGPALVSNWRGNIEQYIMPQSNELYLTPGNNRIELMLEPQPEETGDDDEQVSNYRVLGVTDETSDNGRLYVSIVLDSGSYTVRFYKDSARTEEVGRTLTYLSDTPNLALREDLGLPLSGLVAIDDVVGEDSDIEVLFPIVNMQWTPQCLSIDAAAR